MRRIKRSQLVKARPELVFEGWTDYEAWPRISGLFRRADVIQRDGNTVLVDAEINVMGRKARRTEKIVLTPPDRIEVTGEADGASNRTVWTFAAVPEGTVLTAVLDVKLKGLTRILGPIARHQLQTMLREWMGGLARYVEARQPDLGQVVSRSGLQC